METRKTCALLLALVVFATTPRLLANERDAAVLDSVLEDLTTYRGGDVPLSVGSKTPRTIYATTASPQVPDPPDIDNLLHAVINAVPRAMKSKVRQANDDANAHRSDRHGVEAYRSTRSAVVVDSPAVSTNYQSSYPVAAWSPGYSRDGSLAIVALYFPEFLHPSVGLYLLESTPRGWVVLTKSFLEYL